MSLEIEITKSSEELVSGIPIYLTVTTSVPSTVFYTLDGTTPTNESLIADGNIYMPTSSKIIHFSVIAFDGEEYSDVYTEEYSVVFAKIKTSRKGDGLGLNVIQKDKEIEFSLSEKLDGQASQSSTHKFEDLDIKASTVDSSGAKIKGGTSLSLVNFAETIRSFDRFKRSSPNDDNVYFDPSAKYLYIDGSTEDALNNQSVRVINRPHGTFSPSSKFYQDNESYERNIITGNLVNYVYNNVSGEIIFYYYESKESRWIVSKQKTDSKKLNFGKAYISSRISKFVFQWVKDPIMSKLR